MSAQSKRIERQGLGYWERRYNELFPNGPTQEEIDEACRWEAQQREEDERIRREYPTREMVLEDEQEPKAK